MRGSWRIRLLPVAVVCAVFVGGGATSGAEPPAFEWNLNLADWHVLGPIAKLDRNNGELNRSLVPDEAAIKPGSSITIDSNEFAWRRYDGRMIDFIRALDIEGDAAQNALAYAWTEFASDEDREAVLAISHDDGAVVWLNGEEIYRNDGLTASKLDQATIKVSLKKGANTLLAKVSQGIGSWEFAARLRPAGVDELIAISCDGSWGGDMARLPALEIELLSAEGKSTGTWRTSGGRCDAPRTVRYTLFAPQPQPAPAKVRIRYDAPGLAAFDQTYDWSEVRGGKVSLPLAAAAPIRARVIDEKTGQSVAGAEFRSGDTLLGQRSDADGRLEFAAADPLVDFVSVWAAGYEPRQIRVAWPPDDSWTVKLQPGGHVLRGRVLSSDGKPLAGALISAYGANRNLKLTTDENGRFEAIGLSRERSMLYPTVSHPDYIAKDGFNFPLEADGVTEVEWRLEPGAAITGRVTASGDGRPLEGIKIVSGSDRFTSNRVNPETKTDSEGRYRLGGIKPGPALVHAFSDDFAPAMQKVTSSLKEAATADFVLERGQPVTGRITDPQGKPIAGVTLAIDAWNGARMLDRRETTDERGEFRYENMPATPVEIHIFKREFVSKRDLMAVGGQHYDITLVPVVEHTVSVRLADTGQAPRDVVAQVGYQWPGRDDISWQDQHYYQGTKYDAAAGVFRIRVNEPSTARLSWRLRVPGYKDAVIDNPEPGVKPVALEVVLEKVSTIRGTAVDAETGAPVEGVMVALLNKQDKLRLDHYTNFDNSFRAADEFTGVHVSTAADGSFELPKPTDELGETDLLLFRKGGGFHYLPGARSLLARENLQLPFPAAGALEGRVIVAGKPAADSEVHLAWIAPGADAFQWDLPFGFGGQVTTDAEGRFQYTGLGPGRYRISRIRSFKNPLGGGSMSTFLSGDELVVLPGETVTHEFNQPAGHTVTGTAVGTSDEPLANCLVTVSKANDPTGRIEAVMSDAEGRFTIEHLQAGGYRLSAQQYEMTADGCGLGAEGAQGNASVKVAGDASVTIKLAPRAQAQVARAGPAAEATIVGSVPPDFTGKLFGSGDSFTLSDHFGKVVAIDFWATWCGPCMAVMPEMKELYKKYKDSDDVVFITISLDQDGEALRSVIDEQGIEFPVVFESRAASQAIANAFGVRGIPSSFVIGRNGRFASDRIHGSQLLATTDAAVNEPLDPAFAKTGKPARLTVKLALDNAQSGLPGAAITLSARGGDGARVLEETIRTPGQATQFTWLYPPLEEGGEIHVKVEADGVPPQEKTIAAPQASSEVEFAFTSPRKITGVVLVDGEGTPAAGVKVTAYRADMFRRVATAGDDGKFEIGVLSGSYTLTFTATDEFAPIAGQNAQVEVTAENDPDAVELAACRTVSVSGTVTDEDGAPVAGAQVRTTASEKRAATDDEGRFELGGVPARGSVQLYAIKRPKYAMVTLEDFDGKEPQSLVLGQSMGQSGALAAGAKAPKLTLFALDDGEPIEWQAAGDKESLVVFCALWHPSTPELLEKAKKWADEHQVSFVPVSIDWSLDEARREAERLQQQLGAEYAIRFAGPGGLAIAKDWNLKSPQQAYLVSADGKIRRNPPPGQLP
jgi:thiol-disulfide isomerase/thioredoxin/protocatechuate 3,4-dioxygenase beta subunit